MMLFAVACAGSGNAQSSQFNLLGVTAYDAPELLGFAAQATVQRTGTVRAADLAEALEVIYREDGYFLAEVFVAEDGRTLVVDEGEIGEVVVEGVDTRTYRLIRSYMSPVVGKRPVRLAEFERSMMLVEDIGSISATAEVEYAPGASTASVRVVAQEEDRSYGSLTLDHPSRELGDAATLTLEQVFLGLLTPGDQLRFELSGTAEFDGGDDTVWGALSYRAPVGGAGAYVEGYVGSSTARRDARGALLATDLEGDTAILAFGYPVLRDVDSYGYALIEARGTGSDVDVSGTRFLSDVEVVSGSWIYGKALPEGGAYEYALNASWGQRTSAAAGFDDGDEDFFHLRFGAGYEHPVDWFGPDSTVRAELWGQYSPDRLPGIEEFYIGGREDERGYVFAEAQGDSGISATVEVSRDLFPSGAAVRRLRPFGFLDVGFVTNNDPSPNEIDEETFASAGFGLDAEFDGGLFVRSYVAAPLTDGPSTDAGDAAVYLSVTKTW